MKQEQNKSPLDCCSNQTGNVEKALLRDAVFSIPNFNSESLPRQSWQIADFLGHGAENAVRCADLMQICSFPNKRALRRQVAKEREAGTLIIADNHGYYLPSNNPEQAQQELECYLRTGTQKAISLLRTLKHVRSTLKQCAGQEDMWNEQPQEAILKETI